MLFYELCLIAFALSMDAFAVSICKGLAMPKITFKSMLIVGLYFGFFQAIMPLFGYYLGFHFQMLILSFSHWITFILLTVIGVSMIREARNPEEEVCDSYLSIKKMVPLAIATSIDAFAVGLTFALLKINIISSTALIGITTLILSMIGVKTGNLFGSRYKSKSEYLGGTILILMGIKILAEHLFLL